MELSVEGYCNLLARSRLVTADEVRAVRQRWLREAKKEDAANVEKFSDWLAANGHVTEYQARILLRGHADRFFLGEELYKLLDRIGKGRMAGVYKAAHRLGQTVAIKILPPSKAKVPEMLGRFQREARLAMKLKHPNIVRTFQTGEDEGLHYLVMEYLEGETLDEILERRSKLPPGEACRIIYQALLGLQHLHEQNMVHRDLKPGNLMLVPSPKLGQPDTTLQATVKILDIGLGRALFDEGAPGAENATDLTSEGTMLGTPDYLAPEQARDAHSADIRADVYSLGCALYHALAGQPPFPDNNLVRQMIRHATEAPKPLKLFNPAVPDGLDQIVQWMMAKDPAQRYPTPERAAQALQVFLASGQEARRPPEAEAQMQAYLKWLEAHPEAKTGAPTAPAAAPAAKQPAPAAPAKPAAPAARPAAQPIAAIPLPAKPVAAAPAAKPVARPAVPVTTPVKTAAPVKVVAAAKAAAPPQVDVELVPAPTPRKGLGAMLQAIPLTRREMLLLGIGAGSVAFIGGFVWLAISLFSKKKKPDSTEPEGGGNEEK